MSRRTTQIMVALLLLGLLTACVAGPNDLVGSPGADGTVAGFWRGFWHGFISFFSFVASLFKDNVSVYEVHNNGTWYNLGFILGVMSFFGGGGGGARRRSKRARD